MADYQRVASGISTSCGDDLYSEQEFAVLISGHVYGLQKPDDHPGRPDGAPLLQSPSLLLEMDFFHLDRHQLLSAAYGLGMRSVIQKVNFEDFDSVYYNNILATPIILALSVFLEDWRQELPRISTSLWLGILGSGFFAFAIGFSTAWCMRLATSTSYSMVGALNKLPVAFSGMIFFPKERDTINRGSVLSIIVGFLSGLVYTFAQIKERQARSQLLPISSNSNK